MWDLVSLHDADRILMMIAVLAQEAAMKKFEAPVFEIESIPEDILTESGFDTDPDPIGGDTSSKGVDLPIDWFL